MSIPINQTICLQVAPPKPKKKKASREQVTTAQLFDQMQKHFSGRGGLPQQLDALAEACGGQGANYKTADDGLNQFLNSAKEMRKGKP